MKVDISHHKEPLSPHFIDYVHPAVWPYIGPTVWLAGGAIVRFLENQKVNTGDWDLFSTEPDLVLRDMLKDGWFQVRETEWAWTLEHITNDQVVQVVKKSYSTITEVIDRFDFTVRQFITDGQWLWSGATSLQDFLDHVIKFNNPEFSDSVTSLHGIVKYANRGYTLTYGEGYKFLERWHGVELPEKGAGY